MTEHNLFYYPCAKFTNSQLPLLKVAALWFDKLIILDPVGASWNTVGADFLAREAVRQLEDAGLLEIVTPVTVLAKFENPIVDAIRRDMNDKEFLNLCDMQSQASGKRRWTLALAKVPQNLQTDQAMRNLMGDFSRDMARRTEYATHDYIEHIEAISILPGSDQTVPANLIDRANDYHEYAKTGQAYDEYREGYNSDIAYRYADLPLALGESIMMNHALFAGICHAEATPITDDPFHSHALSLKIERAGQDPAMQKIRSARGNSSSITWRLRP